MKNTTRIKFPKFQSMDVKELERRSKAARACEEYYRDDIAEEYGYTRAQIRDFRRYEKEGAFKHEINRRKKIKGKKAA